MCRLMAIPEAQLETWSNIGAMATSATTYASIREALSVPSSHIRTRNYVPFLQGSYASHTNIYGDSDVDVVVQLNETFIYDTDELDGTEVERVRRSIHPASYLWQA